MRSVRYVKAGVEMFAQLAAMMLFVSSIGMLAFIVGYMGQ